MHVHLVFVTKYRCCSLDREAIEKLRDIFSKVCTDFKALLVHIDGGSNHVHLLVNYPPKVSVSSPVNSLKGVSSYVLRRQLPRIAKCTGRMRCGRLLTSPHPVAAHRST
jgi:putative transposase